MKSQLCKIGLHEECPIRLQLPNGKVFRCDDTSHPKKTNAQK